LAGVLWKPRAVKCLQGFEVAGVAIQLFGDDPIVVVWLHGVVAVSNFDAAADSVGRRRIDWRLISVASIGRWRRFFLLEVRSSRALRHGAPVAGNTVICALRD